MIIRFTRWANEKLHDDVDFAKKKSSFQIKIICILVCTLVSKIVVFGAQKTTHGLTESNAPILIRFMKLFEYRAELSLQTLKCQRRRQSLRDLLSIRLTKRTCNSSLSRRERQLIQTFERRQTQYRPRTSIIEDDEVA